MDYKGIARIAGKETAQAIADNEESKRPQDTRVDGKELDSLMRGATVLGAEPLSYPDTDGVILYLKGTGEQLTELIIETSKTEALFALDTIDIMKRDIKTQ